MTNPNLFLIGEAFGFVLFIILKAIHRYVYHDKRKTCFNVGEDSILPLYSVERLREADSFPYIFRNFHSNRYESVFFAVR